MRNIIIGLLPIFSFLFTFFDYYTNVTAIVAEGAKWGHEKHIFMTEIINIDCWEEFVDVSE